MLFSFVLRPHFHVDVPYNGAHFEVNGCKVYLRFDIEFEDR
jgi:hypothetical protein